MFYPQFSTSTIFKKCINFYDRPKENRKILFVQFLLIRRQVEITSEICFRPNTYRGNVSEDNKRTK